MRVPFFGRGSLTYSNKQFLSITRTEAKNRVLTTPKTATVPDFWGIASVGTNPTIPSNISVDYFFSIFFVEFIRLKCAIQFFAVFLVNLGSLITPRSLL